MQKETENGCQEGRKGNFPVQTFVLFVFKGRLFFVNIRNIDMPRFVTSEITNVVERARRDGQRRDPQLRKLPCGLIPHEAGLS